MLDRRALIGGLAAAALSLTAASASSPQTFDAKTFAAAQAAGKPILLHITAPWCPTCKAQAPILSKLEAEPRFKDLVVLNIDFDSKKDLLRRFNVRYQSTLIMFKGKQEAGRSTGDTNAASIESLLAKAI